MMTEKPTHNLSNVTDSDQAPVRHRVPFEVVSCDDGADSNSPDLGQTVRAEVAIEAIEDIEAVVQSEAVEVDPVAVETDSEVVDVQSVPAAEETVDEAPAEPPVAEVDPVVAPQASPKSETVIEADAEVVEVESDRKTKTTDSESTEQGPDLRAFEDLGLSPEVLASIGKAGYAVPSAIQTQTVSQIMDGRDLIGQAETGSGKTAAFAWPILSRINLSQHEPQVLVLAPTRELAIQVTNAFRKYASELPGFRSTTIYGGQNYDTQLRALARGSHVVVGTPGRVIDHIRRGTLDLSKLSMLVLDEADEMLRMGFIEDVEFILEQTPGTQQSLCFSATMPPPIQRIAEVYLKDPVHVSIKSDSATADSIHQTCIMVQPREKLERLTRFLETEETEGVLVFVKTRISTNVVAEHLVQNGVVAAALNGDIPQQQRERTVNHLKSGKTNVVVATDVAARGLDVSRISHVINYDFPHDTEAYVHRIGRTGRAGRAGEAVLFVEPREKGKLSRLQRAINQPIEVFKQKSLREINALRVEKFKQQVLEATENSRFSFFQQLVADLQSESDMAIEDVAAAMAVLAQGETPLILEALKSPKSNWRNEGDSKSGNRAPGPMQTFRVEVGRNDGVGPGNLVGAITNEANLTNADIGRINIFDRFSTIDLPQSLPEDLVQHLSGVLVGGRPLQLTKSDQSFSRDRPRGGGRGPDGRGGSKFRDQSGPARRRKGDVVSSGRPRSSGRDSVVRRIAEEGDRPGRSYQSDNRSGSESGGKPGYRSDSRGPRSESGSRPYRPGGEQGGKPGYRSDSRGPRSESGGKPYRPGGESGGKPGYRSDSRGPRSESGGKSGYRSDSRGPRSESGSKPYRPGGESGGKPGYRPDSRGPKSEASPGRSNWSKSPGKPAGERGKSDWRESDRTGQSGKPRKKTKAALRTQGKRKPGAELSSPVKKYVKIRAVKKKS